MSSHEALKDSEVLIVLARSLDKTWRRFVYTKELMHTFDTLDEKTDTEAKFDLQIERFGDPSAEISPQFRAEAKAYWRALGVLCPENARLGFETAVNNSETSVAVVAARLGIPVRPTEILLRGDYLRIIERLK